MGKFVLRPYNYLHHKVRVDLHLDFNSFSKWTNRSMHVLCGMFNNNGEKIGFDVMDNIITSKELKPQICIDFSP